MTIAACHIKVINYTNYLQNSRSAFIFQLLPTVEKHNIFSAKIEGIYSIAFSPDGKTIACGTNEAVISLITINYESGKLSGSIP
jgi:WD40 repeat protein